MEPGDDGSLAGWHRDPSGRHELRFWDGTRWTEHIVDEGIPALDHPTRSGQAPGITTSTPAPPGPPPLVAEPAAVEAPAVEAPVVEPPVAPDSITPESASVSAAHAIDLAGAELEDVEVEASAHDEHVDPIADAFSTADPESASVSAPRDPAPSHSRPGRTPRDPRVRHTPPSTSAPKAEPTSPPAGPPPSGTPPVPHPQRTEPIRLIADPPTVASPAGNSAGANTSAIADPHRAMAPNHGTGQTTQGSGPRVAGVGPLPVKRFRPGSPPPSPFARPQTLPAAGGATIGTVVTPWYRKASWIAVVTAVAVGAAVALVALTTTGGSSSGRLGARPPGAAPLGSKVIDGEGFGIAVPKTWIVGTDPGGAFPQLARGNWATPLAATDVANGEAIVVVALHDLAHQPQVDPELFWFDQVRDVGNTRSVTAGRTLSVHGFRANQVLVTDPSWKALVAASIDTGDAIYLVAVTAPTEKAANARFERLIPTFDAR